jgi:hypothetical protein
MKRIECIRLLAAMGLVAILFTPKAQAVYQTPQTDNVDPLWNLILVQPDFTAIQHFMFTEPHGGFGMRIKMAKKGNLYREESEEGIRVIHPDKPVILLDPKRKEYYELLPSDFPTVELTKPEFDISPEGLAKRTDVLIKMQGQEKIGEYSCNKIEVTFKDKKLESMKFIFYSAPELKNLIVAREMIGGPIKFAIILSDVSLNVAEEMFQIPVGYKKIVRAETKIPKKNKNQ